MRVPLHGQAQGLSPEVEKRTGLAQALGQPGLLHVEGLRLLPGADARVHYPQALARACNARRYIALPCYCIRRYIFAQSSQGPRESRFLVRIVQ